MDHLDLLCTVASEAIPLPINTTPPTSPLRSVKTTIHSETPERKMIQIKYNVKTVTHTFDVFSMKTHRLHPMKIVPEANTHRSGPNSVAILTSVDGHMVLRKRFTCKRGPIQRKYCSNCSNNIHQGCLASYCIYYTKEYPMEDDTNDNKGRMLDEKISAAFSQFCPTSNFVVNMTK